MPKSCCAVGCTSRFVRGRGISFFKFPKDPKRRQSWINAVKRKDWEGPSDHAVICSLHFQTKKPSLDENHPDYIPNVFSYKHPTNAEKYERRKRRCEERQSRKVAAEALMDLSELGSSMELENEESAAGTSEDVAESVTEGGVPSDEAGTITQLKEEVVMLKEQLRQAHLSIAEEMSSLRTENQFLKSQLLMTDFSHLLLNNQTKLKFYTSLDSKELLELITNTTVCFVESKFEVIPMLQVCIVLVKFRLNLKDEDIAVRFGVSRRTVERIFQAWIPALAARLKHFIKWPSAEKERKIPLCFRNSIYKDAICILDCTEIFTESPSQLMAKNQMWSNYKHHITIKFLVAISPDGQVCFISNCWGGRASDKDITEKSGILNFLKAGDLVIADRGFKNEQFYLHGIRLVKPSSTWGKQQLSSADVLSSKRISNVRIHIERIIGYLKNFEILHSTLPITFLKYIQCVITICAGLHNLKPGKV